MDEAVDAAGAVGEVPGAEPVVTAATDAAGPLPPDAGPDDGCPAVLRPASLAVGVGASRGVPEDEVLGLIRDTLAGAGLSPLSVAELVTVDTKAEEPGIVAAAARLGVPLRTYPAEELARIEVPHPSGAPLAAVGTPSVAEAAALAAGGELLVPKRKSRPEGRAAMATCAVARRAPRGHVAAIALRPGARDPLGSGDAGGYAGVGTAFVPPSAPPRLSGPDRCVKPGAGRIVVLPYFHFTGVLPDRVRQRTRWDCRSSRTSTLTTTAITTTPHHGGHAHSH
ncbi:Sirohydrochlorin cobaltochelatase [Streptomyces sp. ADI92-24]|nr:Sirohydrochlorin cobaltochelatase [Streptomyces sp. ADI92-24]